MKKEYFVPAVKVTALVEEEAILAGSDPDEVTVPTPDPTDPGIGEGYVDSKSFNLWAEDEE